jgi:predicted MFS family arabinose efflux permease
VALTCFGVAFVLVRIVFGHLPDRLGGTPVALVALGIEAIGQTVLFAAPAAWAALLGAFITGAGCSMVFPSLGVEIVRRISPQIRATALGGFAAFQDLAYALTGPITGLVATAFGYPSVFVVGAACALTGLAIVMAMARGALGWGARP